MLTLCGVWSPILLYHSYITQRVLSSQGAWISTGNDAAIQSMSA
jgi:hypothetical protein